MASDADWANQTLTSMLGDEKNDHFRQLLESVIKSDDVSAKYELITLLMNLNTEKIVVENLRNALLGFYHTDTDLDEYIESLLFINPKFGTISISASHGQNMEREGDLEISIPIRNIEDLDKQWEETRKLEERIKEVLKMILVEARPIKK